MRVESTAPRSGGPGPLIKQGFAVVSTNDTHAGGAGVFLQKQDRVYVCYVTETPTSPALTPRYCKPVQ